MQLRNKSKPLPVYIFSWWHLIFVDYLKFISQRDSQRPYTLKMDIFTYGTSGVMRCHFILVWRCCISFTKGGMCYVVKIKPPTNLWWKNWLDLTNWTITRIMAQGANIRKVVVDDFKNQMPLFQFREVPWLFK